MGETGLVKEVIHNQQAARHTSHNPQVAGLGSEPPPRCQGQSPNLVSRHVLSLAAEYLVGTAVWSAPLLPAHENECLLQAEEQDMSARQMLWIQRQQ